jgi:hypothetical protein
MRCYLGRGFLRKLFPGDFHDSVHAGSHHRSLHVNDFHSQLDLSTTMLIPENVADVAEGPLSHGASTQKDQGALDIEHVLV